MKAYYETDDATLHLGSCLDVLPTLASASVDAIVTDPPYELGFMGKAWDASGIAYNVDVWRECWRILKPGGHLLAFGGTRTYHRMTVAIEDAGFEIRDSLHWIYGSGFPKSLNVSKEIDKAAGAQREVIRPRSYELANGGGYSGGLNTNKPRSESAEITAPASPDAVRWSGFGTGLKPAHEPIALARKPLSGTVVANVFEHGTGALNIDACRTAAGQDYRDKCASVVGLASNRNGDTLGEWTGTREDSAHAAGRWPTNILLGHGPDCTGDGECQTGCPVAEMDQQSGVTRSSGGSGALSGRPGGTVYGAYGQRQGANAGGLGDTGGASRFFPIFRYEAKAPSSQRPRLADGTAHTTVKPLALMRWLVRLVTPPGGTVLDPFAGTATTLAAALREGMTAIGIEQHEPYAQLAVQRLSEPYMVDLFADGGAA